MVPVWVPRGKGVQAALCLKVGPAAHDEDEGVSERRDAKVEVLGPRNGY